MGDEAAKRDERLRIDGRLFRVRCLNSLVTQTGTIDAIKVRHSGDVQHKFIEGTYRVLGKTERTLAAPQDWSSMRMNEEANILADACPCPAIRRQRGRDHDADQGAAALLPKT